MKLKVQEILNSDLKIIEPEIVKTDKIIYETSQHSKSEYYRLGADKDAKTIHITYSLSKIMIEGDSKELFLKLHKKLQEWIEEQFEIISEGKAMRFNN